MPICTDGQRQLDVIMVKASRHSAPLCASRNRLEHPFITSDY